jgi:Glycosyl transferase family 21
VRIQKQMSDGLAQWLTQRDFPLRRYDLAVPHPESSVRLRVQTVLYGTPLPQVWRLLRALDAAARHVIESGLIGPVELAIGDSSPTPTLSPKDSESVADVGTWLSGVTYEWFGANLGSSGGQNRLAEAAECDLLMVLNPDTYPSPPALTELARCFAVATVAIAEARQFPLEHPKAFDALTGETGWASGACMMVRTDVFRAMGGFDAEHFLLHCDDVDFSWRVRAAGYKIVHAPSAAIFHDKRPRLAEAWPAPPSEQYHAVLGRLMLATRWDRPDIVESTISHVEANGTETARHAVEEFCERARRGRTPSVASDPSVAEFVAGEYAPHRF